jgi:hypothetical protein
MSTVSWGLNGGRGLGIVVGVILAAGAVAWAAEVLTVVERDAPIRRSKRTYSPALARVEEGGKVSVLEREPPWLRVEYGQIEGWMLESAVTDDPNPALSNSGAARGVRVTEQSAAKRGFSPEVEGRYVQENPDLVPAYKFLDQIEKTRIPDERIVEFLRAGQLGDFGGGSAPGGVR